MIHFLTSPGYDLDGLDDWDPDLDPTRHPDDVGHNLLELHRRLAQRGRLTTVGSTIPSTATAVAVLAKRLQYPRIHNRIRAAWALRRHRVVMIRSDVPLGVVPLFRIDVEVAPNQTFADRHARRLIRSVALLPLPQRGLMPRAPDRGERLEVISLKCNPENIPPPLVDSALHRRLTELDVRLEIDAPSRTNGADQRWHDFSTTDVVLCARQPGEPTIVKPATKLLNAWSAGGVVIASREPAYVELATAGEDVLFLDRLDDLPHAVRRLKDDPALRASLRQGASAAAARHADTDRIVDAWWDLLCRVEAPPSRWRAVRAVAVLAVHVARQVMRALSIRAAALVHR